MLQTARLRLRRWTNADREPFAAMNADPLVMEYFPDALSRQQSDRLIGEIENGFEQRGFGLWAVEVRATGAFIGFTGLSEPSFEAHFTPAVEVSWRLARAAWGEGYATEAAKTFDRIRFRRDRPRPNRFLRIGREHAVARGHGEDRNDAQPRR